MGERDLGLERARRQSRGGPPDREPEMVSAAVALDQNGHMGTDGPFEEPGNDIPGKGNGKCKAQRWER